MYSFSKGVFQDLLLHLHRVNEHLLWTVLTIILYCSGHHDCMNSMQSNSIRCNINKAPTIW